MKLPSHHSICVLNAAALKYGSITAFDLDLAGALMHGTPSERINKELVTSAAHAFNLVSIGPKALIECDAWLERCKQIPDLRAILNRWQPLQVAALAISYDAYCADNNDWRDSTSKWIIDRIIAGVLQTMPHYESFDADDALYTYTSPILSPPENVHPVSNLVANAMQLRPKGEATGAVVDADIRTYPFWSQNGVQ